MKRPIDYSVLDNFEETGDYKYDSIVYKSLKRSISNINWIYIARDFGRPDRAKVGLTTGDLSSRSYSSGNPDYSLFCAFKCDPSLSSREIKSIEKTLIMNLCLGYERINHTDSQRESEWFIIRNIADFFYDVHLILYENHRDKFDITSFYDDCDGMQIYQGEYIDCLFNSSFDWNQQKMYILQILMD